MTRFLVPPVVQEQLKTLNLGALALAADEKQVWLVVRSAAPEHLGAQPIDLRSELTYYETGAVLELQLWLAGALLQPAVYQTWMDPANPAERAILNQVIKSSSVEILFFAQDQDHLRFSKSFPLSEVVRQRLLSHLSSGRLHAEHVPNPFWLAAKSEHLRRSG